MSARAYYNEIDPYAAAWLRNLIAAGHIADGDVDERSIVDVRPSELLGYTQCHFFAGIGGWSRALRIIGWPDDRPVWTGSCPCQPFSAAGKRGGFDDERHLWPYWDWLIQQCAPPTIFGEQVASKDGLTWLDLVSADLEGSGYAFAASDLCAAGVGAPHIRQRLWFVAHAEKRGGGAFDRQSGSSVQRQEPDRGRSVSGFVAHADDAGSQGRSERGNGSDQRALGSSGVDGRLANADGGNASAEGLQRSGEHGQQPQDGGTVALGNANRSDATQERSSDAKLGEQRSEVGRRSVEFTRPRAAGGDGGGLDPEGTRERNSGDVGAVGVVALAVSDSGQRERPGPTNGFWRDADWLYCRDGKWRPVEPGTFPLAHGIPGRVGRLRAYGNAIVPQVAAVFIGEVLEVLERRIESD